ncbi:hypothetical protein D3C71_1807770 [compost metagenome]
MRGTVAQRRIAYQEALGLHVVVVVFRGHHLVKQGFLLQCRLVGDGFLRQAMHHRGQTGSHCGKHRQRGAMLSH